MAEGSSKSGSTLKEHMIAGGTAGVVARTCIAPMERIKIMFQVQTGSGSTPMAGGARALLATVVRDQGVASLWKGNSAAVVRVIPYSASTFVFFEEYRTLLLGNPSVRAWGKTPVDLIAGSSAGCTAVLLTYPLDLARAKLATSATHRGMAHVLSSVYREQGFRGLYRGISPTVAGVVPYAGLKFASYEALKVLIADYMGVQTPTPLMRLGSGTLAGVVAQTFVYPLDVMRRRMQTGQAAYPSVLQGLLHIARTEGVMRGLFRGLSLNYAKTLPNVAITMTVYDLVKQQLTA